MDTKAIQEWLTYHGFATVIDGIAGIATEACVQQFQRASGLPKTGVVDPKTAKFLEEPLALADAPINPAGMSLARMVVAFASQHAAQYPIEIGGENRGPWVRLYMEGHDGTDWPWCCGFATYIVKVASAALKIPAPFPLILGCDLLAETAVKGGRFLKDPDPGVLQPGYLFLVRRADNPNFYQHVGIIASIDGATFQSIEGNSNNSGSSNGYEVTKVTRQIAGKDFIRV